jgi:CBS-domain-containing membrane protein
VAGYLIGVVGPQELARDADYVGQIMAPPIWLDCDAPMSDLIPLFMGGQANSVVVTDHQGSIFGVVTPLDVFKKTPQTRCNAAEQIAPLRGSL